MHPQPQSHSVPKKATTILRWPGGKTRLLARLLPLIPPHTRYVEPFAGGLALLFAKPPSPVEVVNDLNPNLVSLYRCVRWHLPALLEELTWALHSRQDLRDFIAQPGLTEIQRVARWYARNRMSFAGCLTSYQVGRLGHGMASRIAAMANLHRASQRLAKVNVENLSYEQCLKRHDHRGTFFFVDPPYLHANPQAYAGWNEEQMTLLRERLDRLKGRWLVTVNDCPFTRKLFSGCKKEAVCTRNGALNPRVRPDAQVGELIIQLPRSH